MGAAWESWGLLRALGHLQKTPLHTLTVAHLLRGITHAPWRCLSPWDVTGCLQGCWPPWLDGCKATAVPLASGHQPVSWAAPAGVRDRGKGLLPSTWHLLPHSRQLWSGWQSRARTHHHCSCPSAAAQLLHGSRPQTTWPLAKGRGEQQPCTGQAQASTFPLLSSCAGLGLTARLGVSWVGRSYLLCTAIQQEGLDGQLQGRRWSE